MEHQYDSYVMSKHSHMLLIQGLKEVGTIQNGIYS